MSFNVHLVLRILAEDGVRSITGYKEIELPFVPFKGLRFSGRISEEITSIIWSTSDSKFYCNIDVYEELGDDIDVDFLVRQAKKDGWKELTEL